MAPPSLNPDWVEEFNENNQDKVEEINKSKYSIYKHPKTLHQVFENAFSVAHQIKRESGETDQAKTAYNDWKRKGFEKDTLENLVKRAESKCGEQQKMTRYIKFLPGSKPAKTAPISAPAVPSTSTRMPLQSTPAKRIGKTDPNVEKVDRFASVLKVRCNDRSLKEISSDLKLVEMFDDIMKNLETYQLFKSQNDYAAKWTQKNSNFSQSIKTTDEEIADLKKDFEMLVDIVGKDTSNLTFREILALSKSTMDNKKEAVRDIVRKILKMKQIMPDVLLKLRKRLSNKKNQVEENMTLSVRSPNFSKTWVQCLDDLDIDSGKSELCKEDFEAVANFFHFVKKRKVNYVTPLDVLKHLNKLPNYQRALTKLMVDHLPLLSVKKGSKAILLDAEMYYDSGEKLADLIDLVSDEALADPVDPVEFSEPLEESKCSKKVGRKRFIDENPEILEAIRDFCTNSGVAAHCKRRNETGMLGFRIPILKLYIQKKFFKDDPSKAPSLSTVRRIFDAPSHRGRAKGYYHEVIKARPVSVRNDDVAGSSHSHSHICFSMVKMVRELCSKHSEVATVWSVDDKAKVPYGCAAVGRLGKQKKFFEGNTFFFIQLVLSKY